MPLALLEFCGYNTKILKCIIRSNVFHWRLYVVEGAEIDAMKIYMG